MTLNYGLGWQIDTPLVNHRYDGLYNNCFIPGQQSTIFPTAPVGLDFPGDPGCTTSGYHQHNDNFAPRFGFAYSPNWGPLSGGGAKKFVIRGGYGIYFNRAAEELALQQLGAPPFFIESLAATGAGGSSSFANPYVDISTGQAVANPFPFTPATKGQSVNFSQFEPLSISTVNPNLTDAYAMNYNLNIQRELPGQMILQVGYVGLKAGIWTWSTKAIPFRRQDQRLARPTRRVSPTGTTRPTCTRATACTRRATCSNRLGCRVAKASPITIHCRCNSKRLARGLMFQAAYTWSHSIDDSSVTRAAARRRIHPHQQSVQFRLEQGRFQLRCRHRFVVNYTYELPLPHWNNAFGKYVVSGWRLAGITTLQTGFPIIVGDSSDLSLQCPVANPVSFYGCWDVPNVSGYPGIYNPRNATLRSIESH